MEPAVSDGIPDKIRYAEKAERDGYKNVGRLGIAFFQKKCLAKKM